MNGYLEILATLGTKKKQNTTQKAKKYEFHGPHQKSGLNPGARG